MNNVCAEIYKTIFNRAINKERTKIVKLPSYLFETLKDDEFAWLKNSCGVSVIEGKDLTEPQFLVSLSS